MPKRIGGRVDRDMGMTSISQAVKNSARGLYPRKGAGLGEYGSTAYPTVIESYNRTSDYSRWKAGQELFYGAGRSWAEQQIKTVARFTTGAVDGASKEITVAYPSSSSPEKTWYVSCRTRGSIMFPQPITANRITLNTSDPDPANHTLVLDVNGILSSGQLGVFNIFIGDQFEDSATSVSYPDGLVERDVGSVALTLLSVNTASMTMTFDLSRPAGRVQRNGHIYWSNLKYDPAAPISWRADGTRHLCSSLKFFCCCPDHLGGALANLEFPDRDNKLDRFPLPNAARTVVSPWEQQGVGYYRQWRTLPRRRDERRDCKHIHALRWECGVPWLEPDDYPVDGRKALADALADNESRYSPQEIMEFFRTRQINWDRYVLSIADVVGLILFPGGNPRDAIRPDPRPILWNDSSAPDPTWCRINDWWLERGTQRLKVFNTQTNQFEETITGEGFSFPVLEHVGPGSPVVPVIVP